MSIVEHVVICIVCWVCELLLFAMLSGERDSRTLSNTYCESSVILSNNYSSVSPDNSIQFQTPFYQRVTFIIFTNCTHIVLLMSPGGQYRKCSGHSLSCQLVAEERMRPKWVIFMFALSGESQPSLEKLWKRRPVKTNSMHVCTLCTYTWILILCVAGFCDLFILNRKFQFLQAYYLHSAVHVVFFTCHFGGLFPSELSCVGAAWFQFRYKVLEFLMSWVIFFFKEPLVDNWSFTGWMLFLFKIKIVYSVWQQCVLDSHNCNKIQIQIRQWKHKNIVKSTPGLTISNRN